MTDGAPPASMTAPPRASRQPPSIGRQGQPGEKVGYGASLVSLRLPKSRNSGRLPGEAGDTSADDGEEPKRNAWPYGTAQCASRSCPVVAPKAAKPPFSWASTPAGAQGRQAGSPPPPSSPGAPQRPYFGPNTRLCLQSLWCGFGRACPAEPRGSCLCDTLIMDA